MKRCFKRCNAQKAPEGSRLGRRHRGLTLAEVLIAGSISAMLLISVATAYDASTQAVEVNVRYTLAAQTARIGMRRIVDEIRTCETCQVGTSAQQSQSVVANATNLDVIRPDGTIVSYVFDKDERVIRFKIPDPVNPIDVVLARHVEDARFTAEIESHPQTGVRRTVRVSVELEIRVDGQPLYLSGSGAPRREMVY